MPRIEIQNAHDRLTGPDTPIVSGQLEFNGQSQVVNFLVDTGACNTTVNGQFVSCTLKVWGEGDDHDSHGVGVNPWPSKRYDAVFLTLQDKDGNDIRLKIPSLVMWSPYVDGQSRARMAPTAPGRNRRVAHKPCINPNLLGRDVFSENGLALIWNPKGESYIEVLAHEKKVLVDVPRAERN